MNRLISYSLIAWALVRSTAGLARRGKLLAYLRQLKGSHTAVAVNLFISLKPIPDTRRLRQLAWRAIWCRLYNDVEFEELPWTRFRVSGLYHLERSLTGGRGAIVCTQHLGPYRRVFYELIHRGFRVNLLVDARVSGALSHLQSRIRRWSSDASQALEQRFTLLNAERPGAVRQIFDALERNEVVLIYLDGNTGVGGPGSSSSIHANNVEVNFFGQQISVRRGVCQISYLKGAPLVPLFARWEAGLRAVMEFQQPIIPCREMSLDDFCVEGMQRLFRLAEEAIRARPQQFEEWVHLHRWRLQPATDSPIPDAASLAEVRQQIEDPCGKRARRFRLDSKRVLVMPMGESEILADAMNGRFIKPGPLMGEVVRELVREIALDKLLGKLEPHYPRPEILEAMAQLKVLKFVVETPE